jgi:hypothetical protein
MATMTMIVALFIVVPRWIISMTMFAVALYPREQQQKTTTTTTTTVAPTAAKVDSTARRNVWFNNVLLSIQDSVCAAMA